MPQAHKTTTSLCDRGSLSPSLRVFNNNDVSKVHPTSTCAILCECHGVQLFGDSRCRDSRLDTIASSGGLRLRAYSRYHVALHRAPATLHAISNASGRPGCIRLTSWAGDVPVWRTRLGPGKRSKYRYQIWLLNPPAHCEVARYAPIRPLYQC